MQIDARKEWPIESYMQCWKLFRRMSDENKQTAMHLLARRHWPHRDALTILDVGCGDGLLLQAIIHLNEGSVAEVRLLDPDEVFLRQALEHITETDVVNKVRRFVGRAEHCFTAACPGVTVVLALHVVYLMGEGEFAGMLGALPPGIPLYVVLDTPGSIFTCLWKKTAERYRDRSASAHRIIEELDPVKFHVGYSTLTSSLSDPLTIKQRTVRDSILSILCYSDVSRMTSETLAWVEQQIQKHTIDGRIVCESACYEVVRL